MAKVKVCIMQPTLLPYQGYFDLIKEADIFVFFDNVQFKRKSFHHRNKVNLNGKDTWLTIPVAHNDNKLLNNVNTYDTKAIDKVIKTVKLNYNIDLPQPLGDRLIDITIPWIETMCGIMGIEYKFVRSSSLGTTDIVEICEELGCTDYLTTGGTRDIPQLEEVFNTLNNKGITVRFIDSEAGYSAIQNIGG